MCVCVCMCVFVCVLGRGGLVSRGSHFIFISCIYVDDRFASCPISSLVQPTLLSPTHINPTRVLSRLSLPNLPQLPLSPASLQHRTEHRWRRFASSSTREGTKCGAAEENDWSACLVWVSNPTASHEQSPICLRSSQQCLTKSGSCVF